MQLGAESIGRQPNSSLKGTRARAKSLSLRKSRREKKGRGGWRRMRKSISKGRKKRKEAVAGEDRKDR